MASLVLLQCSILPPTVTAQADSFEAATKSGYAAVRAKRWEEAIEQLGRAHALKPQHVKVARALAGALSFHGAALHEAREFRDALRCYERADRLWPRQIPLVLSIGQLALELGDDREAKQRFEAVLELDPKNARALANLGRIAAAKDDIDAAADFYDRARTEDDRFGGLADRFRRHAEVEKSFKTLRHGMFELQFPAGRAAGVEQALPAIRIWLSQSLRDLRRDLGRAPSKPVKIVLYAKGQYRRVSTAKHWAKAYFDGKVRLDLGAWPKAREELRRDLRHELAHAFLEALYPKLPAWLQEGYAQVIEGRDLALSRSVFRRGGAELLGEDLFVDRFVETSDVQLITRGYAQSHLAVAYLRDLRTPREFARLLGRISAGRESADALREVYRVGFDEVFQAAVPAK